MSMTHSFWEGKEPCWEIMGCGRFVREKCVAWTHQGKPCWEHPHTQCPALVGTAKHCGDCKVFWRYGTKRPTPRPTGPASGQ